MNIPPKMTAMFRSPLTKAAFISDYPQLPGCCPNCGGAGVIVAFIATDGPYDTPAHPYLQKDGVHLTSKSDEIAGKIKYWVGRTISEACPDCQNTQAPVAVTPSPSYYNVTGKMKDLAEQKRLPYADD